MESVRRENDEDNEVRNEQRKIEGVDVIQALEAAIREASYEFPECTLSWLKEQ